MLQCCFKSDRLWSKLWKKWMDGWLCGVHVCPTHPVVWFQHEEKTQLDLSLKCHWQVKEDILPHKSNLWSPLLCWGRFLLCLFLEEFFIINGCWILLKAFFVSIEIIIWFLSFNLLIWHITLIDLHILKNPCIPRINLTWSRCMIFLMCCWILFARILLRIFASIFINDIGL